MPDDSTSTDTSPSTSPSPEDPWQLSARLDSQKKGLWCYPCKRPFGSRPNYLQHMKAKHGYTGPIGRQIPPRTCPHCDLPLDMKGASYETPDQQPAAS